MQVAYRIFQSIQLLAVCLALVVVASPSSYAAESGDGAKAFIEKMGQDAIDFLADASLSQAQKEQKFQALLDRNFDMPTIGRFVMGRNWSAASPAQQKEYQSLFQDMVVRVYSSRIEEYQGHQFDVASFRDTGKGDFLVTSYIVPASGSKVQIDWRVRGKNGGYKIVDIIIEGVSMTLTQRSEFASIIQRGGGEVEVLLAHLRQ
jgi:phospholipid transport system substrate-binding protein